MSLNKMCKETNNNPKYELIPFHNQAHKFREECHQLLNTEFPKYFELFGLVFALLVLCCIPF